MNECRGLNCIPASLYAEIQTQTETSATSTYVQNAIDKLRSKRVVYTPRLLLLVIKSSVTIVLGAIGIKKFNLTRIKN